MYNLLISLKNQRYNRVSSFPYISFLKICKASFHRCNIVITVELGKFIFQCHFLALAEFRLAFLSVFKA